MKPSLFANIILLKFEKRKNKSSNTKSDPHISESFRPITPSEDIWGRPSDLMHKLGWGSCSMSFDIFALLHNDFEVKNIRKCNGPRQANLVLIAYASSEGSGEPAHPRSLARTFAARSYKQWVKRNLQTESQTLAPLNGWAYAVKIYHDGMLEDTNSLDGALIWVVLWLKDHQRHLMNIASKKREDWGGINEKLLTLYAKRNI